MARENVVSFRLDEKQFSALKVILKRETPIGVASENGLARKFVVDFLQHRLRYINELDRLVDCDQFPEAPTQSKSKDVGEQPTGKRFSKVQKVLEKVPGFAKHLKDRTEIVCRPDGTRFLHSAFVIQVTEAIHKRGKDAYKVTKTEIIQNAIHLVQLTHAPKKVQRRRKRQEPR